MDSSRKLPPIAPSDTPTYQDYAALRTQILTNVIAAADVLLPMHIAITVRMGQAHYEVMTVRTQTSHFAMVMLCSINGERKMVARSPDSTTTADALKNMLATSEHMLGFVLQNFQHRHKPAGALFGDVKTRGMWVVPNMPQPPPPPPATSAPTVPEGSTNEESTR